MEHCNVPGCREAIHDCHGGEIYLCIHHWQQLVKVARSGAEPDDWWNALIVLIRTDLEDVQS